ncbi:MAG: hypothetical protein L6277_15130 [Desulfobacterales bacterium]|nr:hypothetical protein [Pseudomonadota bacterium]MCG2773407.1 hypothetical protein [Desulfobacterales bacterium]
MNINSFLTATSYQTTLRPAKALRLHFSIFILPPFSKISAGHYWDLGGFKKRQLEGTYGKRSRCLAGLRFKGVFPLEARTEKAPQAGPLTALFLFVAAEPDEENLVKICSKSLG